MSENSVTLILPGELPTLTSTNVRQGYGRSAVIATHKKRAMQAVWLMKMKTTGRLQQVHQLQRDCAKAGRKIEVMIFVYRRHELDEDNLWTACNKLLLDPLQQPRNDPVIYNDRTSNLEWRPYFVKVGSQADCGVAMLWSMSEEPCGATTRRRFREERRSHE